MPGVAVRLGIDIGSATTKAVLTLPGGGRMPLMPDGIPHLHSGVFLDPDGPILVGSAARSARIDRPDLYLADPATALTGGPVPVGDRTVSAAHVYAAILAFIRTDASHVAGQPVNAVIMTVPPRWGRIRRDTLRDGAALAGFTDTTLVAAPTAITAHVTSLSGAPVRPGGCVLVCDAGASTLDLTVLEHIDDGLRQLATAIVTGAAGRDIDQLIATHLLQSATPPGGPTPTLDESDPQWQVAIDAAEDAKLALAGRERTAVALHDPYPPQVLDRADLTKLVEPVLRRLDTGIADVLAAADIHPGHLSHVILTGGGAHLPGLAQTLTATTGRPPHIPARTDLAAADGALTTTLGATAPPPGPVTVPRVKLRLADLVRPAVFAVGSLTLIAFVFMTLWTGELGGRVVAVHLAEELISAAAVVAVLTAWSVAHLLPTVYLTGDNVDHREAVALIRVSFVGAATLGTAAAGIYGLAVGALVGATRTEYLNHALIPAIPVAAAAFLIAALAGTIPAPAIPGWLAQLRHPLTAALLGTLGILAMRYAVSTPIGPGLVSLIIRAGAATTGVAIAFTIVRDKLLRAMTAVLLAIGGLVVGTFGNNRAITLGYIAAVIWWATTRLAITLRAAYPELRRRLRQLVPSAHID